MDWNRSALLAALLAGACAAAAPAAPGVSLGGCLARPGQLDAATTAGLPAYRRLVKVAAPGGAYRCALEVEGYALKDVLDRLEVKKTVDDGYDRPLDTCVAVTGRDGRRALFSYSEVFLAGDGGPLLVPRARLLLPHKHDPVRTAGPDPTAVLLDPAQRAGLDLSGCAQCHNGEPLLKLALPSGWLLAMPGDGFGGRFVEDVAAIDVVQVGIPVKADRNAAKGAYVAEPALVGPAGGPVPLTPARFAAAAKVAWKDATFGMGMGFHGIRAWEGVDLGSLLRPLLTRLLPAGADPTQAWVLVTAVDGYRTLYSGAEVFAAPPGRGVGLAARINGAALGKGSGRYHVVPRSDFYVDRDVFLVKEIRLGLPR
jgi:hypothetical protein